MLRWWWYKTGMIEIENGYALNKMVMIYKMVATNETGITTKSDDKKHGDEKRNVDGKRDCNVTTGFWFWKKDGDEKKWLMIIIERLFTKAVHMEKFTTLRDSPDGWSTQITQARSQRIRMERDDASQRRSSSIDVDSHLDDPQQMTHGEMMVHRDLAKLWCFTNLGFPEIRGFPLLSHQLGWGRVRSL